MKKSLLLPLGLLCPVLLFAGRDVNIKTINGDTDTYYSADIDSINNDGSSLFIYEKERVIETYHVSEIDQIWFGEFVDDDDASAFIPDTIVTVTFKTSSVSFAYKDNSGNQVTPKGVQCSYSTETIGTQNYLLVTINSVSKNIGYVLTGGTSQRYGGVTMYSEHKCSLTINKLKLINENAPAINIQTSKRTFVEIGDGVNELSDKGTYPAVGTVSMKAAFFSEGELIFNGAGENALTVTGNVKHGLASDDYVHVYSGTLNVNANFNSPDAQGDGIKVKDKFLMHGGSVTVTAKGDGIDCTKGYIRIIDGTLTVNSGAKGIKSSYDPAEAILEGDKPDYEIDPYVLIDGGTINITTGTGVTEGKKAHGIKANSNCTINGGNITITSNNLAKSDGVSVDGKFYMNGGAVNCTPYRNCYDSASYEYKGGTFNCNK